MTEEKKKKVYKRNVPAQHRADWYKPFDETATSRRKIYWNPTRIEALGDTMVKWFHENHTKVTLGSFCWDIKIPATYLSQFAKRNRYFAYCLGVVKSLLETRLVEMGLAGEIDKVMAIFSLKNVAGWTDKREVQNNIEVTSKVVELRLPKKKAPVEVSAEIVEAKKVGKTKQPANAGTPAGKSSKVS